MSSEATAPSTASSKIASRTTVLDCTIRDGGLVNNHHFTHEQVRAVYSALSDAGVDIMELGYYGDPKLYEGEDCGPWRFCRDEDIARVTEGIDSTMRLSVMADVGRTDLERMPEADTSFFHVVRAASYLKDLPEAIKMIGRFHDMGYTTSLNLMAISREGMGRELEQAALMLADTPVDMVYIVDSFGSLFPGQVRFLCEKFTGILGGRRVGFHAHNNQQLGFANTIEAIKKGVSNIDATLFGMGRAAGNCPLELLLGYLKDPRRKLEPVLDCISEIFIPLREQVEWGYIIPYAITGILGEHPKPAMAMRQSEDRENYRSLYEQLTESPGAES